MKLNSNITIQDAQSTLDLTEEILNETGPRLTGTESCKRAGEFLGFYLDKFCNDIPREFVELLNYCYKLDFDTVPNYDYIKQTFVTLLQNIGQ